MDQHLQSAFADRIECIRELRPVDHVLDEICRDFEEIAALIANSEAGESGLSGNELADLQNSLRGLRQEIDVIVQRHGDRTT